MKRSSGNISSDFLNQFYGFGVKLDCSKIAARGGPC